MTATDEPKRVKFDWVHVSRPDLPRGTILDLTQSKTDTVDLKMENGQVDEAPKQETITKEKALSICRFFLENDRFPDGLSWGPSSYDW